MNGFKLIVEAIRDLFWPLSPHWLFQKKYKSPAFAFIVHPRDVVDVYKKYPHFRILHPKIVEWFLYHFWPVVISEVTGLKSVESGMPIRGWVLSIPLTAKQMMTNRTKAVAMIRRSIKLAHCKGATIVGLGALTASITYRGKDVEDLVKRLDMGITSGVGYTAFNITEISLILLKRFRLNPADEVFAVVGAAGAIGSATIRFLLHKGIRRFVLIDLDRKHSRIEEIINKKLFPKASFYITAKLAETKRCRFIITATNAPEALIKSEHLSPGTIIIDDAQPSDIDPGVVMKRDDVLVIEGGVTEVNGISPNVSFGLKHDTDVFSCLAEVMVLAAFNRDHERSLDYANPEDIEDMGKNGNVLGFSRAELQNFQKVYSEKDLDNFYKNYLENK